MNMEVGHEISTKKLTCLNVFGRCSSCTQEYALIPLFAEFTSIALVTARKHIQRETFLHTQPTASIGERDGMHDCIICWRTIYSSLYRVFLHHPLREHYSSYSAEGWTQSYGIPLTDW